MDDWRCQAQTKIAVERRSRTPNARQPWMLEVHVSDRLLELAGRWQELLTPSTC